MDSSPRRWVLKPLSPLLQPSDLRSIAVPSGRTSNLDPPPDGIALTDSWSLGGGTQAVLVRVESEDGSTSDDYLPSSPGSSSGSHCGFYSFVEDPASPEAERNQAWMTSPQRQTRLATLKQEQGFRLQTYSSGRKPESLFSETNGDRRYQLDPSGPEEVLREDEEKQLRKEIIRNQAPRRNPVDPVPPTQQVPSWSVDKLIQGFSMSFGPVQSGPEAPLGPVQSGPEAPLPSETDAVDEEQRDFRAVRQQFLQMEQERLNALLLPARTRTRTSLGLSLWSSSGESRKVEEDHDGAARSESATEETNCRGGSKVLEWEDSSVFEDLDFGLQDGSATEVQETPIQREIRLVQEREENLRRSRGLNHSSGTSEMIQIRTRRLLSSGTPVKDKNQDQNQDQNQHQTLDQTLDIQLDQWSKEPDGIAMETEDNNGSPTGSQLLRPAESGTSFDWKDGGSPDSGSGPGEGFPSPCCPHRHPAGSEFQTNRPASSFTVTDSVVLDRRRFYQDATSPSPRSWKDNLESTGLRSRGQGAPDFIEKEIEEVLRREQELRDLRENRKETSPPPLVDQESRTAFRKVYPSLSTETPLRLSSMSPRGLTESLLRDYEERRGKLRLDENTYAGIQLIDDVNNELVESTRVILHKNQRALRWEAGMFANQENE